MKILVVDDNSDIRDIVVRMLKSLGHDVITADDGKPGARLCLTERPDLTITDMSMLHMDGPEMIENVRKRWPEARFLGMSASTDWKLPADVTLLQKPGCISKIPEYL